MTRDLFEARAKSSKYSNVYDVKKVLQLLFACSIYANLYKRFEHANEDDCQQLTEHYMILMMVRNKNSYRLTVTLRYSKNLRNLT